MKTTEAANFRRRVVAERNRDSTIDASGQPREDWVLVCDFPAQVERLSGRVREDAQRQWAEADHRVTARNDRRLAPGDRLRIREVSGHGWQTHTLLDVDRESQPGLMVLTTRGLETCS